MEKLDNIQNENNSVLERLSEDEIMISDEHKTDEDMNECTLSNENNQETSEKSYIIKENSDTNEDWKSSNRVAKEKILPEDYIINIEELWVNPQIVPRDSKFGIERGGIEGITKYLIQEGKGEVPLHKDRVVHTLEIRYSSGLIYDLSKRKEQRSVCIQDNKQYKFFLDIIKSMRAEEVALFKIQFTTEELNFYIHVSISMLCCLFCS